MDLVNLLANAKADAGHVLLQQQAPCCSTVTFLYALDTALCPLCNPWAYMLHPAQNCMTASDGSVWKATQLALTQAKRYRALGMTRFCHSMSSRGGTTAVSSERACELRLQYQLL